MNFLVEPSMLITMGPVAAGGSAQCSLTCSLTCNLDGSCSSLNCGLIIKPAPKEEVSTGAPQT